MSSVISLARLKKPSIDLETMLALHLRLLRELQTAVGQVECTLWQAQSHGDDYMVVTCYPDAHKAETGFEALIGGDFFVEATQAFDEPIDLHRSNVRFADGASIGDVPPGKFLSISQRTAEPGHGDDLSEELRRIFGELSLIDGYLGSAIGQEQSLAEEIIGLVYWSHVEAYMDSLPLKVLYEVRLFHRLQ